MSDVTSHDFVGVMPVEGEHSYTLIRRGDGQCALYEDGAILSHVRPDTGVAMLAAEVFRLVARNAVLENEIIVVEGKLEAMSRERP
jgi:hypothetical protein